MLHDVVVVGAGPVGSVLALALADSDLDLLVLDARHPGEIARSDRSLALSHGARLILERTGVWSRLAAAPGAATPVTRIDISQAGGFGQVRLTAEEQRIPALGYVVSYRALQGALDASLTDAGVALRYQSTATSVGGTPAYAAIGIDGSDGQPLIARLAAIADGNGSGIGDPPRHRHDYGQVALVATISRDEPHGGVAYERFTPEGPIALFPEGEDYGLVWTVRSERAQELIAEDEASFLAELGRHLGTRIRGFTKVARRRSFPLTLEFARGPAPAHCVALGNAAQTLHPVAAQGLNMGLRDAYVLAQQILDSDRVHIGDRTMLSRYARERRRDRMAGIAFTHGLVSLFGNDLALMSWPRGLALTVLDTLPAAKRAFTGAMMFGVH